MRKILLQHAGAMSALVVLPASALAYLLGRSEALGLFLGGSIAALDFLGIVYLIGGLLAPDATSSAKLTLGMAFGAKLLLVALSLWWTVRIGASGIGIGLGIVLAIIGFTLGMLRGSAAAESLAEEKGR